MTVAEVLPGNKNINTQYYRGNTHM